MWNLKVSSDNVLTKKKGINWMEGRFRWTITENDMSTLYGLDLLVFKFTRF